MLRLDQAHSTRGTPFSSTETLSQLCRRSAPAHRAHFLATNGCLLQCRAAGRERRSRDHSVALYRARAWPIQYVRVLNVHGSGFRDFGPVALRTRAADMTEHWAGSSRPPRAQQSAFLQQPPPPRAAIGLPAEAAPPARQEQRVLPKLERSNPPHYRLGGVPVSRSYNEQHVPFAGVFTLSSKTLTPRSQSAALAHAQRWSLKTR